MNRFKKLSTIALAGALAAAMTIPCFAANILSVMEGSVTNYIKTDSYKGYENYPCWIWFQGYCYYYENADNYLKSTTTPDGYTVDELGRWTVDGKPVHNGAGNYKMNTEDYLGRTDDEIWELMKGKLESVYKDAIIFGDIIGETASGEWNLFETYSYGYGKDMIWSDNDTSFYGDYGMNVIRHNDERYRTYITAAIDENWSDQERNVKSSISKAYYSYKPDSTEKTIKCVVGDKIGTELFNYIKIHADKIIPDPEWNPYNMGDGVNSKHLDLSAWKNRTTDYGKRFTVDNADGLTIFVYND